jgi:PHP domain
MDAGPLNGRGADVVGVVHVHSTYSHDGRDTLEDLGQFAKSRGIAFIGLTDHAEDFTAGRFDEYASHCRAASDDAVTLLPGLEYRFAGHPGLHLLALGLRRWMAPQTPAEFTAEAPAIAGLTIVAHPLLPRYRVPPEVAAAIDAVEVWNAAYNTRYLPDPRAVRLLETIRVRRPNVVGVAGLDQHDSRNDRETRVVLHRSGAADPLAELRAGRFDNVGRTMRFASRAPFGPTQLAGLSLLRLGLDTVNRVHERLSRALRRHG